jgi:hypothetical protein
MLTRILRMLSVVSLLLLVISALQFTLRGQVSYLSPPTLVSMLAALVYQSGPTLSFVTGIIVLVVSAQRRQWRWFWIALVAAVLVTYTVPLLFASGLAEKILGRLASSGGVNVYGYLLTLGEALLSAPLPLIALAYTVPPGFLRRSQTLIQSDDSLEIEITSMKSHPAGVFD